MSSICCFGEGFWGWLRWCGSQELRPFFQSFYFGLPYAAQRAIIAYADDGRYWEASRGPRTHEDLVVGAKLYAFGMGRAFAEGTELALWYDRDPLGLVAALEGGVVAGGTIEAPASLTGTYRTFFTQLPTQAQRAFLAAYESGVHYPATEPIPANEYAMGQFLVENAGSEIALAAGKAYAEHPTEVTAFAEVAIASDINAGDPAVVVINSNGQTMVDVGGGGGVSVGSGSASWEKVFGWLENGDLQQNEENTLAISKGIVHAFDRSDDLSTAEFENATARRNQLIEQLDTLILRKQAQIDGTASVTLRCIRRIEMMSLFVLRTHLSFVDLVAPKSLMDVISSTIPAARVADVVRDLLINSNIEMLQRIFPDE